MPRPYFLSLEVIQKLNQIAISAIKNITLSIQTKHQPELSIY